MHIERNFEVTQAVPICGGYQGKPLWIEKKNKSTYYDYSLNVQGYIPLEKEDLIKKNYYRKNI